jgi:16S rRNA processing protein RimM
VAGASGEAPVEVGFVARAHGIRGELRVVTHDPDSTSLERAGSVLIGGQLHEVLAARRVKGATLLCVAGIDDRDAAEAMRGAAVAVARADLDLGEGEVLLADLVGCDAVLEDGRPFGRVMAIEVGPQSRLVIHDGDVERLLPVVDAFVVEVDLPGRRVVVAPPEDLPETPRG